MVLIAPPTSADGLDQLLESRHIPPGLTKRVQPRQLLATKLVQSLHDGLRGGSFCRHDVSTTSGSTRERLELGLTGILVGKALVLVRTDVSSQTANKNSAVTLCVPPHHLLSLPNLLLAHEPEVVRLVILVIAEWTVVGDLAEARPSHQGLLQRPWMALMMYKKGWSGRVAEKGGGGRRRSG